MVGVAASTASSSTSTTKATKALMSTRVKRDRACTWLSAALIVGALFIRVFFLTPSARATTADTSFLYNQQHDTSNNENEGAIVALPEPQPSFLPLDPTCTMADDIVSIQHVPHDSWFVVTLKPTAKCRRPYLRGRLSGPALVLLEWTLGDDQLKGRYQVPVSGLYFVELIVVMCHDFSTQSDYDFQNDCVEDPQRHRLVKSSAKVSISTDHNKHPSITRKNTMGFWRHQLDERVLQQDFAPVLTRFQPRGCLRMEDPTEVDFIHPPRHCVEPTNLHRFEPYTQNFEYYTTQQQPVNTDVRWWEGAHRIRATQPTTICLVGGSHSRTLLASLVQFHNFTLVNNNIHIDWVMKAKYPRDVNNKTISAQLFKDDQPYCDKILLAVGQWPASFSGGKPTSFRDYAVQIQKMVGRLQDHYLRKSNSKTTQVWFRSIHDNPLNDRIAGYCPPKDWRSPTVMEGYNHIVRNAVARADNDAIRFVSTQFIVGPLWDASSDWNHVLPLASHAEALYLVAVVLGLVQPNAE